MHENQTFKDELLGSNVEIRRPRAEQMRCPEASQGPMPEAKEPRRGGAWETPRKDRESNTESHDLCSR